MQYTPLSTQEIQELLAGIKKHSLNITTKDIVELDKNGFKLIYGGDLVLGRLQEELTLVDLKQVDIETWYLKRKEYTLTKENLKYLFENCRYNK